MKKMSVKEAKLWEQYEEASAKMVAAMDRGDTTEEEKWEKKWFAAMDKLKKYM